MTDDAELLRRYLDENSSAAFAELVQRHLPLVYATALRGVARDAHLAEDAAQIVFSALARKAPRLRDRESLAGWLYVSAHRAAAMLVRTECRRKTREQDAHLMQTLLEDSAPEPELSEIRTALDQLIVGLRADEREAIALRFFQQRSFAEIGAALRLTEEAARKRLDRALEKLRVALNRQGVTSTTALLTAALAGLAISAPPAGLGAQVTTHALMQAARPGLLASFAKGIAIAGALLTGGYLILQQQETNRRLEAELARLENRQQAIAALRAEDRQLAQRAREAGDLRRAAAEVPARRATLAPALAASAETAPVHATLTVQANGTLAWGKEPVTLAEFMTRMKALPNAAPGGDAKLGIRGFSEFSALAWVIDEARKAQLRHVVVESDTALDPKMGAYLWFGPR
jgi:RNA polymerase sigma factor (sigma-70 family)